MRRAPGVTAFPREEKSLRKTLRLLQDRQADYGVRAVSDGVVILERGGRADPTAASALNKLLRDPAKLSPRPGLETVQADVLGAERSLAVTAGDRLAILSAGAYGMAMSSNYNTRPLAAEVLVDGDVSRLVRRRQTVAELITLED